MKTFTLEFRNENGGFLFSLMGASATLAFQTLKTTPEFIHTTKKIKGKGEFVVLECIKDCGYKLAGFIEIIMSKGGYIKCFHE